MKTKILVVLAVVALSLFHFNFVSAAETEVFSDDFEVSNDSWFLEPGWSIISESGNPVLQGTQQSSATAFLEGAVNKLELKLKLVKGGILINIRSKSVTGGLDRYFIGLNQEDSRLSKQAGGSFSTLQDGGRGISLGAWHRIKIEIVGKRISVYSDDNLIVFTEDENMLEVGGISFEMYDDSTALIDDVRAETSVPETREIKSADLFPQGEHRGDITISGRDFLILEDGEFIQYGNIYLKDSSKLVIRDSTFKMTRYEQLLNHWGIYLDDGASLEVENSKLMPGEDPIFHEGTLFVIDARGQARVTMKNSPTRIHLFMMFGNAKAVVENSEIIGDIGGLVSAHDKADVRVINSKIGAVSLEIPSGAIFEASGFGTGLFKDWNLRRDTKNSGIGYNIILQNTELIPDKIGPGPFERGWPVFIESGAKVKIKDSELRKVVVTLRDEKAQFSNFYLEKPSNFDYRDIHLENVKVMGQWGIFLNGSSDVVVRDSDAFWTFIYDDSRLKLINTHMNEFDPRNFRGEIVFENSKWDTAAEILENNNFTIKGSLEIGQLGGFSWENSKIKRIYDVIGSPGAELSLLRGDEVVWSGTLDKEGNASFELNFDGATFNDSWVLKDNVGHTQEVTFFSKTPIDMEQNVISKFISTIRRKISSDSPSLLVKIILPFIIISLFVILFLSLKKRRKQI